MVVKIRLARFGRRNSPFYNIVVAHARYVTRSIPPAPTLRRRAMFGVLTDPPQHGAQLPASRGPRHVRPRPQARPLRRLGPPAQGHQARHAARALLGRRRRAAHRHGLAAAVHGRHPTQEGLWSQGEQEDGRGRGRRRAYPVSTCRPAGVDLMGTRGPYGGRNIVSYVWSSISWRWLGI